MWVIELHHIACAYALSKNKQSNGASHIISMHGIDHNRE